MCFKIACGMRWAGVYELIEIRTGLTVDTIKFGLPAPSQPSSLESRRRSISSVRKCCGVNGASQNPAMLMGRAKVDIIQLRSERPGSYP